MWRYNTRTQDQSAIACRSKRDRAVRIGVFGATYGQALDGVVGPLIEVPVLVALVYVALAVRRHWVKI